MSKVKIQGNASGTGVVTLTAPNTNTDRTITLPDDTQTLIGTNASGNVGIGTSSPDAPMTIQRPSSNQGVSAGISLKGQDGTTQGGLGTDGVNDNAVQLVANEFIKFHTNNTDGTTNERMRILSSGGITFNGDTAAANALDDYEEGTYTAAFVGVGTVVLSSNVLKYKKVGNMVTTGGQVRVTSQSGVTGGFKLTLPFTSAGGLEVGAVRLYTVNFNDAARGPICYTGGAELVFDMSVDNSSSSAVPVTTSGYYMFGITYQTA